MTDRRPPYRFPTFSPETRRPPAAKRGFNRDQPTFSVFPSPYYRNADGVGRYIQIGTGSDLTEACFAGGFIAVGPDGRQEFILSMEPGQPNGYDKGDVVVMNLFNKDRGQKWEWHRAPEQYSNVGVICQANTQEYRFLSLAMEIEHNIRLSHFPWKAQEPRLRPTTHGKIETGKVAGYIMSQKRVFPVFDTIFIFEG